MDSNLCYALLDDMRQYVPESEIEVFKRSKKITNDFDDFDDIESLVIFLRNYYEKHLPVGVTAWARVNEPDSKLIYRDRLGAQIVFVRDDLGDILCDSSDEYMEFDPLVIATHKSKSVLLPIYQLNTWICGLELVIKYNFSDWAVSVKADKPIIITPGGLFNPSEKVPWYVTDGIPEDKVYSTYAENQQAFTFSVRSHYKLYTLVHLIKQSLISS